MYQYYIKIGYNIADLINLSIVIKFAPRFCNAIFNI